MDRIGLCECGCGKTTPLFKESRRGHKRGEHLRFIRGHSSRKTEPEYRIEDRGFDTPCWIWTKALSSWGYGRVWKDNGLVGAHRDYWERYHGPIPPHTDVHHLCSQPPCVNPTHLVAITRRKHMKIEGRKAYGRYPIK